MVPEQLGDWIDRGEDRFFVGREFETRLFEQYLLHLPERTERILNIYGTGGMGKSFLLDRFRNRAMAADALFLHVDVRDFRTAEALCAYILDLLQGSGAVGGKPMLDMPTAGIQIAEKPAADFSIADMQRVDTQMTEMPAGMPIAGMPKANMPVADSPLTGTPMANMPVADSPLTGTPMANMPVAYSPLTGTPMVNMPAAGQCAAALNGAARSRRVVLAFDHYEEIGSLDQWLRDELLARLSTELLTVIAGRYPLQGPWKLSPAWRKLIVFLPLNELQYSDVQLYMHRCGVASESVIDAVWLQTMGHPLMMALIAHDSPEPASIGQARQLDDVLDSWLREVPDEALRDLVQAASLMRVFNLELLAQLTERDVPASLFDRLVRLSFVKRTAGGWELHDTVREAARHMFRSRTPGQYAEYVSRSIRHGYARIVEKVRANKDVFQELGQLLQFAGNPILRAHYRHSRMSANYWETLSEANLTEAEQYIRRRHADARECHIRCADPETGTMFRYTMSAEQSLYRIGLVDLKALLQLDSQAVRLMRCPEGRVVGLSAIVPIHEGTVAYLRQAPLSHAYFGSLSPQQLAALSVSASQPAGWFILTVDVENVEREELRSDIVHVMLEQILNGGLLLASPPPFPHYTEVHRSLGFDVVPELVHYDYDGVTPTQTFVMNTRGKGLIPLLNRLVEGLPQAPPAKFGHIEAFTPREQEVADLLAEGLTNAEIAARLFVSEAAVKKHINSMLGKFGVKNRTQLLKAILEHD